MNISSEIRISRILHAGYIFEAEGYKIAFDPIFENPFSINCHAFPNVEFNVEKIKQLKLSAIFISHFHEDHCSLESLKLLNKEIPIYIFCVHDELPLMITALGFKNVWQLILNQPLFLGPFEITPRRALDADVDSIFQIKAFGLNILNVVDSWIDLETLNLLRSVQSWDLVLWPFQTMREVEVLTPQRVHQKTEEVTALPVEWIEQLKILKPQFIVPSSCQFRAESWSWYNKAMFPITYKKFQTQMGEILPESNVIRMNPGVSISLNKSGVNFSEPLEWIVPVGDQNVDYQFDPEIKVPPTSEISKHFVPLTSVQTEFIYSYCQTGLIEKYKSLPESNEDFFKEPRFWRLIVYDHTGADVRFNYQLNHTEIRLLDRNLITDPVTWQTEISVAKFYAALKKGESLTSLYIRINDLVFSDDIEIEVSSVDPLEDPLIRCLYFGTEFGAYQANQLRKLMSLKKIPNL